VKGVRLVGVTLANFRLRTTGEAGELPLAFDAPRFGAWERRPGPE
jgi:hypothetical protein